MKYTSAENIWDGKIIKIKGSNLILFFDKYDNTFNFMKLVGRMTLEKDKSSYRNEIQQLNITEVEEALKLKYLKIPESIRTIAYFMKPKPDSSLGDVKMWGESLFGKPVYFVVDYPAGLLLVMLLKNF